MPRRDKTASARPLALALIGCGEIAVRNAEAVMRSGAAAIRWAVDSNLDLAKDMARRWGGRPSVETAPALQDGGVDAVFVCTPHHLHAPLALDAIRAGKHVIVEKPTARNAGEASAMAEAARAASVLMTTLYPMRFLPQVLAARRLVREGAIGRIQGVRIMEHLYKETTYWYGGSTGRSRSSWRAEKSKSGGGVLLMNLCHHLDALLFVTGRTVRRVYGEAGRADSPGDVEDIVAITMRLDNDGIVSVDASTSAPGDGISLFQIWGSDGQIALDPPARFLSLRKTAFGAPNVWNRLPLGKELEARSNFVSAFAAAVLHGSVNPVAEAESIEVQRLIDAIYASAERHAPVVLPETPQGEAAGVASTT